MLRFVGLNSEGKEPTGPTREEIEAKYYEEYTRCIHLCSLEKIQEAESAFLDLLKEIQRDDALSRSAGMHYLLFLIRRNISNLYEKQGNVTEAAETLSTAAHEFPIDDAAVWDDIGRLSYAIRDFHSARTAYEKSLHLSGDRWGCYKGLSRALLVLGDYEGLLAVLLRAFERWPDLERNNELRALFSLALGELDAPSCTAGIRASVFGRRQDALTWSQRSERAFRLPLPTKEWDVVLRTLSSAAEDVMSAGRAENLSTPVLFEQSEAEVRIPSSKTVTFDTPDSIAVDESFAVNKSEQSISKKIQDTSGILPGTDLGRAAGGVVDSHPASTSETTAGDVHEKIMQNATQTEISNSVMAPLSSLPDQGLGEPPEGQGASTGLTSCVCSGDFGTRGATEVCGSSPGSAEPAESQGARLGTLIGRESYENSEDCNRDGARDAGKNGNGCVAKGPMGLRSREEEPREKRRSSSRLKAAKTQKEEEEEDDDFSTNEFFFEAC
eukprot:Rmarinus@m.26627